MSERTFANMLEPSSFGLRFRSGFEGCSAPFLMIISKLHKDINLNITNQLIRLLVVFFVSVLLSACGESDGAGQDDGDSGSGSGSGSGQGGSVAGLCSQHVTVDSRVIGNNVYEFRATSGACFGRTGDSNNLVKREVTIVPVGKYDRVDVDLIEMVGSGRLTYQSSGLYLFFAADVKNTSEATLCFPGRSVASFRNTDDDEVGELGSIELLGDTFSSGDLALFPSLENTCIPAGETRMLFGSGAGRVDPDDLETLGHIELALDFRSMEGESNQYFPEALLPQEAVWTTGVVGMSSDHPYSLVGTFMNMTSKAVYFSPRQVKLLHFDDDNYLMYDQLASIEDYLNVDEDDLVDDDYLLTAMGGSVSVADKYYSGLFFGRASKAVFHLKTCDQADSMVECDFQY